MIRSGIIATAILAIASPALALSCLRPDVARSFQQAQESEDRYIVVHGTLTFDEAKLPEAVNNDSPPLTSIPARLEGKALSKTGFDHVFERDVTLDVLCFGPWCAGASSGTSYLGFIKKTEAGYTFTVDPCASLNFPDPTEDMLSTAKNCFTGQACKAE